MNDKKYVEQIADMNKDFSKWYTDVILKSELAKYSGIRGCMYVQPYGTALWENIKKELDDRFKETGHENVMLPTLIPEQLLQKEKDHVEGFSPEVAWVTHGGDEELSEKLCLRPTSETLFCDFFSDIIHSYRDLPKLYNQWANVFRWEKSTKLFLRTVEFYWQEGHTLHETSQEAIEETEKMLNIYADFAEKVLAIPVIKGKKTDKEKFAGAESTYTIEAIMHDGQALQAGTSHYFGDGFARAYDIKFMGRQGKIEYPFQTSWGVSTRLVGAIIMTHGDNNGLVLPPIIAPIQVIIIPIAQHKNGVIEATDNLYNRLKNICRVKIDKSDNTAGWKFSEYEMKGVPIRIEIGPKDIEKNQCIAVRRDNREKIIININNIENDVKTLLKEVQEGIFQKAIKRRNMMVNSARSIDEFRNVVNTKPGLIKAMWCGNEECELKLKEEFGVTSRCIPFDQEKNSDSCICCGKQAKYMVVWGKAY